MVIQTYPIELQFNKIYSTDTEVVFLRDWHVLISNASVLSFYDKRNNCDFDIVHFLFFGWRRSSCTFL